MDISVSLWRIVKGKSPKGPSAVKIISYVLNKIQGVYVSPEDSTLFRGKDLMRKKGIPRGAEWFFVLQNESRENPRTQ